MDAFWAQLGLAVGTVKPTSSARNSFKFVRGDVQQEGTDECDDDPILSSLDTHERFREHLGVTFFVKDLF